MSDEMDMASLDPRWAGGRSGQISADDEAFIVATANTRLTGCHHLIDLHHESGPT
jgi:hypothetical protein